MASAALNVGFHQLVSGELNLNWIVVTTSEGRRQLNMQWSSKKPAIELESQHESKHESMTETMRTNRILVFPSTQSMNNSIRSSCKIVFVFFLPDRSQFPRLRSIDQALCRHPAHAVACGYFGSSRFAAPAMAATIARRIRNDVYEPVLSKARPRMTGPVAPAAA